MAPADGKREEVRVEPSTGAPTYDRSHSRRLGSLLSAGRESFSRSMSTMRMSSSQGDPMIPITLLILARGFWVSYAYQK